MSNNTGGPAFPSDAVGYVGQASQGMTLRDYFAAKALPALIQTSIESAAKQGALPEEFRRTIANAAYAQADAMLKARQS